MGTGDLEDATLKELNRQLRCHQFFIKKVNFGRINHRWREASLFSTLAKLQGLTSWPAPSANPGGRGQASIDILLPPNLSINRKIAILLQGHFALTIFWENMPRNRQPRDPDIEPISSDEEDPVFDRASYRRQLKEYKKAAKKENRRMCKLEFKKHCETMLNTAHLIMQDYVQFHDDLAETFRQLSVKDREADDADDTDDDADDNDDYLHAVGLQDVWKSLNSTFSSNFEKMIEPLPRVRQMGTDYRAALQACLNQIREGYAALLLQPPEPRAPPAPPAGAAAPQTPPQEAGEGMLSGEMLGKNTAVYTLSEHT